MLKTDCLFFPGDKPCSYHKEKDVKCDDCSFYEPIEFKILIIKLDAIGDVLRTTSILPPLKNKYPKSHITWCTRKDSGDIFVDNFFVNELLFVEDDAYFRINTEKYDLVINLDTSKFSSAIASSAYGKHKVGFLLNEKGYVEPTSESAKQWLLMSAFDDVKKENERSYQEIMYDILDLNSEIEPPILYLPKSVVKKTTSLYDRLSPKENRDIIGLNVGVGTKWPSKGWPLKRWEELITVLQKESFTLLLLGGPEEEEKMKALSNKFDFVMDTGCDNSIVEFAAIVNLCDILITADTLALHIGNAMRKEIVVLFGPTSDSEIHLYGKGIKILSPMECNCYYKRECTESTSCMEIITANMVYDAIKTLMKN